MISVSLTRIVEGVMARSALLYAAGNRSGKNILGRDNIPALRRAAIDVLAHALLELAPVLADTNIKDVDAADNDIITASLRVAPALECALQPQLESMVVAGVLAAAYGAAGADATAFEAETDGRLARICTLAALGAPTAVGRLRRGA